MGRRQYGGSSLRVRVGQDGSRRSHYEHDDRGGDFVPRGQGQGHPNRTWRRGGGQGQGASSSRSGGGKTVSFKDRGGGIKKRLGPKVDGGGANLRNIVLDDNDESMAGGSRGYQAGRARPSIRAHKPRGGMRGGRGRGGYVNASEYVARRGVTSGGGGGRSWHRVQINNGGRYAKDELLPALKTAFDAASSGEQFQPINFQKKGPHIVFHVDSLKSAQTLKQLDQRITLTDGSKLSIQAVHSPPPPADSSDETKQRIKQVMSQSRYNAETKALDLRKFYTDPSFLGEPIYAALNRSDTMKEVVRIIGDNIPDLAALELSSNHLAILGGDLEVLTERAPNVAILHLSSNYIRDLKQLRSLKKWKLTALKLDGNPLVKNFSTTEEYQRAVQKIFPTLQTLDDKPLPKQITFDTTDEAATSLPAPIQKMAAGDPQKADIALEFLGAYFRIYDSGDRQQLLDAYHQDATMSMACSYPPNNSSLHGSSKNLSSYIHESRNLLRVGEPFKRSKLMRRGKLNIVSFLNNLPKTEHDTANLSVDVHFAVETMITLTLSGIFREKAENGGSGALRHFNRMFVLMAHGSGWNVVNETLFVTNPTAQQAREAFKTGTAQPGIQPQQQQQPAAAPQVPDAAAQMQMMQMLAQKTNMNEKFTKMCLDEAGWNLDLALTKFTQAQAEGKIPIEAYEKM